MAQNETQRRALEDAQLRLSRAEAAAEHLQEQVQVQHSSESRADAREAAELRVKVARLEDKLKSSAALRSRTCAE